MRKFEIISQDQFDKDFSNSKASYLDIKLPQRSTSGAAGYDFYCPYEVSVRANEPILIPTGIRCQLDKDNVLLLAPRSSMGFKYGMQLLNTLGVIDFDYYYSNNEGHIMAKIKADKSFIIHRGDRFIQGIIMNYITTDDDNCTTTRNGGIGSTGN